MAPGKSGVTVEAEEVCINLEPDFVSLWLTRYNPMFRLYCVLNPRQWAE